MLELSLICHKTWNLPICLDFRKICPPSPPKKIRKLSSKQAKIKNLLFENKRASGLFSTAFQMEEPSSDLRSPNTNTRQGEVTAWCSGVMSEPEQRQDALAAEGCVQGQCLQLSGLQKEEAGFLDLFRFKEHLN